MKYVWDHSKMKRKAIIALLFSLEQGMISENKYSERLNDKINKLGDVIKNIQEENKSLSEKVAKLNFELHNPPKYKVGDKVKKGKKCYIVNIVDIYKVGYEHYTWIYIVTDIDTGEQTTITE